MIGRVPSAAEGERLLAESHLMNGGPWDDHSRMVARAARAIAAADPRLDPERAYVLGLLHDVGRRTGGPGVADVPHLLDGHAFLSELGYDACARGCLTHPFP